MGQSSTFTLRVTTFDRCGLLLLQCDMFPAARQTEALWLPDVLSSYASRTRPSRPKLAWRARSDTFDDFTTARTDRKLCLRQALVSVYPRGFPRLHFVSTLGLWRPGGKSSCNGRRYTDDASGNGFSVLLALLIYARRFMLEVV
jgi:hypothetical protein